MKQFTITSTINIEAESREKLDKMLAIENEQGHKIGEIAADLLRNAEIDEA